MTYSDQNFPHKHTACTHDAALCSLMGCRNRRIFLPLSICPSVFVTMYVSKCHSKSSRSGATSLWCTSTAPRTVSCLTKTTRIERPVACWFTRRVLGQPYSVARSKTPHCLCTALADPRLLWTRSSLESEKFTVRVRNTTHARFEPSLAAKWGWVSRVGGDELPCLALG